MRIKLNPGPTETIEQADIPRYRRECMSMIASELYWLSVEAEETEGDQECLGLKVSLRGKTEAVLSNTGAQDSTITGVKWAPLKQRLDIWITTTKPQSPEE